MDSFLIQKEYQPRFRIISPQLSQTTTCELKGIFLVKVTTPKVEYKLMLVQSSPNPNSPEFSQRNRNLPIKTLPLQALRSETTNHLEFKLFTANTSSLSLLKTF